MVLQALSAVDGRREIAIEAGNFESDEIAEAYSFVLAKLLKRNLGGVHTLTIFAFLTKMPPSY